MSIRPLAGIVALSLVAAVWASTSTRLDAATLSAMVLLAATGIGLVVFAMQERRRESGMHVAPVRLRKGLRR
jgi:hypothetical protein